MSVVSSIKHPSSSPNMRNVAILLTLMMLLGSLIGCLGEDDAPSLVGEWYNGEEMVFNFKEDGSFVNEDGTGTWSIDGDTLTIDYSDDPPVEHVFVIEGDWMWLKDADSNDNDCFQLSQEPIDDEEWDEIASAQTTPSMCE